MIKDIEAIDEMEGYLLIINCIDTYISNNPEKISWTFSYKTLKRMAEGLVQDVNMNLIVDLYEEDGLVAFVDEPGKLVIMLPENQGKYLYNKVYKGELNSMRKKNFLREQSEYALPGLGIRFPRGAIIVT